MKLVIFQELQWGCFIGSLRPSSSSWQDVRRSIWVVDIQTFIFKPARCPKIHLSRWYSLNLTSSGFIWFYCELSAIILLILTRQIWLSNWVGYYLAWYELGSSEPSWLSKFSDIALSELDSSSSLLKVGLARILMSNINVLLHVFRLNSYPTQLAEPISHSHHLDPPPPASPPPPQKNLGHKTMLLSSAVINFFCLTWSKLMHNIFRWLAKLGLWHSQTLTGGSSGTEEEAPRTVEALGKHRFCIFLNSWMGWDVNCRGIFEYLIYHIFAVTTLTNDNQMSNMLLSVK